MIIYSTIWNPKILLFIDFGERALLFDLKLPIQESRFGIEKNDFLGHSFPVDPTSVAEKVLFGEVSAPLA